MSGRAEKAKKSAVPVRNLETARNSGLACIAVTWGFRNREFLKEHGAVMIVDSTEEILDLIIG